MDHDIPIAVGDRGQIGRDLNAAQHKPAARLEAVQVVAVTDSKVHFRQPEKKTVGHE
jgi:hypothetical protein